MSCLSSRGSSPGPCSAQTPLSLLFDDHISRRFDIDIKTRKEACEQIQARILNLFYPIAGAAEQGRRVILYLCLCFMFTHPRLWPRLLRIPECRISSIVLVAGPSFPRLLQPSQVRPSAHRGHWVPHPASFSIISPSFSPSEPSDFFVIHQRKRGQSRCQSLHLNHDRDRRVRLCSLMSVLYFLIPMSETISIHLLRLRHYRTPCTGKEIERKKGTDRMRDNEHRGLGCRRRLQ